MIIDKFLIYPVMLLAFAFMSCGSGNQSSVIATDTLSVSKGQLLFQANCSGCHGFYHDGIGPNLSGVMKKDSIKWLKEFIRSPKTMIESGDVHAGKLFAGFHSVMPSFASLNEDEMDNLMAFLYTKKDIKKPKEYPFAIKNPVTEKIPASGIVVNLDFFTRVPASSDKQPLTRISKIDWVSMKSCFILDQRGKLYKMVKGIAETWLDISKWKPSFIDQPGLATGFGSFAFHPDYIHNGIFYTTHTEPPHSKKADFSIPDSIKQTLQWVLCEWKSANPLAPTFSGTNRELMRIDMVAGIHGVQEITFNPLSKPGSEDYGLLFVGVGDGGSVENDCAFLTHHPDKIWGSILRIDPQGRNSVNKQYGIPALNPFANSRDSNTVREIYAEGFRNPNRITWTPNCMMLATNIGQANIEAVDIILKGHDYGWPVREGKFAMHPEEDINKIYPLPSNDSTFHYTYPVAEYDHDEGKAIAGGFVYEGVAIPQLRGKYLFGDIPTGRLFYINVADLKPGKTAAVKEWFVSLNGIQTPLRTICGQDRVDLRFAKDGNGEIYLFTKPDGKIYRLARISD